MLALVLYSSLHGAIVFLPLLLLSRDRVYFALMRLVSEMADCALHLPRRDREWRNVFLARARLLCTSPEVTTVDGQRRPLNVHQVRGMMFWYMGRSDQRRSMTILAV